MNESTKQADIEQWIDSAATMGEEKVNALPDLRPLWLRFTAIAVEDKSSNVSHTLWAGSEDRYDMNDFVSGRGPIAKTGLALAAIAMGWALRHIALRCLLPSIEYGNKWH